MTASHSLTFDLTIGPQCWTVQGPASPPRQVASPFVDERFRGLVASLREWACRPVPLGRPDLLRTAEFVARCARRVSAQLTEVLLDEKDRRAVVQALAEDGRAQIAIRVRPAGLGWDFAADAALALPWELIAPEELGSFPVRDGRLAVLREAIAEGSPDLPEPTGPLTLAVIIAAPEDRTSFSYEQEAFRLVAALYPLGQRAIFSDLGSLGDLADLVGDIHATAIHFRGHGLPGSLLFEDKLGFAEEVSVNELRRQLATILLNPRRAGPFPGLFFLAAPFTAREPSLEEKPAIGPFDQGSASAGALHRSGFAQVVGYFGPVDWELSTRLEERFYSALAEGKSTLDAAEEARAALLDSVGTGEGAHHYPFGWSQLAVYHRGPDRPLAVPGCGTRLPTRFRRKMVTVNGLPVLERGFIGRRELLHEIRRRLEAGQRLLVLQGLGGLGKTALATRLLRGVLQVSSKNLLVLRCQEVERAADPILALRGQAEEHGRFQRLHFWTEIVRDLYKRFPEPVAGFIEVVRALRCRIPGLTIYVDNTESLQSGPRNQDLESLGSWKAAAEPWWHALQLLEAEGEGLILLSTRYLWQGLDKREWLGVYPMGRADSLRMINSASALGKLPLEFRLRLAERVDGHPRTVVYLNSLVAQHRRQLGRRTIRDAWRELVEPVLPEQAEQITADLLLREIWRRLSNDAREHAKRIGVLRAPAPAFVVDRLGEVRDELVRAGLLLRYRIQTIEEQKPKWLVRWGFHSLVKNSLVLGISSGERRELDLAVGIAYEDWVARRGATWDDQGEGIFHLLAAGQGDRSWPLLGDLVIWLRRGAQYQEAKNWLEKAVATGLTGENLAWAYVFLAQVRQALGERREDLRRLLEESQELSTDETISGYILYSLGHLLAELGQFQESEKVLHQALDIQAKTLGTAHRDYAGTLHCLAALLVEQGRYEEAEPITLKVLRIMERSTEPESPDLLAARHDFASLQAKLGFFEEAESLLQKTLRDIRAVLGEEHPDFSASLHQMAVILSMQGKYVEAETFLRRSLDIKEKTLGIDHPDYGTSLHQLAFVQIRLGKFKAATELALASLKIEGCNDTSRAATVYQLANSLHEQGAYEDAEKLLRQALSMLRSQEAQPERVAFCLHALGVVLYQQDREDSEALFREALSTMEQTVGRTHPKFAELLPALALLLSDRGDFDEAERLFRESIAIIEKVSGENLSLCPILTNLAVTLSRAGKVGDAEPLLQRALSLARNTQDVGGPYEAQILNILAQVQAKLGRREASSTAWQALEALQSSLGPSHPMTLAASAKLLPLLVRRPPEEGR